MPTPAFYDIGKLPQRCDQRQFDPSAEATDVALLQAVRHARAIETSGSTPVIGRAGHPPRV
jgi:hypothetical protein